MELNGLFLAPTALHSKKEVLFLSVWKFWRTENSFFLCCMACSIVTVLTKLPETNP
jgi:hypothetical protein